MSELPIVALFGRVNVGKSTLFNRLAQHEKSMVMDYAGVTRDVIQDTVSYRGTPFVLVDTGGVSVHKAPDQLTEHVRNRALALAQQASAVLFVLDGSVGVTLQEQELAKWLHKHAKKVVIVVNKTDVKTANEHASEYARLGFETVIDISATHATGVEQLLDAVLSFLPRKKIEEVTEKHERMRVVLLGKPNVGKSSLMNALLSQERSIVSDVPGTTREAVTAPIQFYAQTIDLTDTAGVRRKRSVSEPIEELMVKSSLSAVRQADIVLLLVDATEGRLSDQELKLAFYVFEQGKALIILLNKDDLMTDYARESWKYHRSEYAFFYDKLDVRPLSCKSGKNIGKVLTLVTDVWARYRATFTDSDLTRVCKQALMHRPLYRQGELVRVYSFSQIKTAPPTIKVVVSDEKAMGERELGFIERVLRDEYELRSVPLRFVVETKVLY